MRLHPNNLQVLQLLVLLDQEQGRHHQATADLNTGFKGLGPGQRLGIGLLLADLLRQIGSHQAAIKLYGELAQEYANDTRPLLAQALLRQKKGDPEAVHALLKQAWERWDSHGRNKSLINVVAGQVGLSAVRATASKGRQ